MKNLLLTLALFTGFLSTAQFDRWSFNAETGLHAVGDQSALVTDAFNHFGATARYNFTPTVGLGLSGGFDNLTLQDLSGYVGETNYARLSTELFVDIFDILSLQNNVFTILGHGGPGISRIEAEGRYTPSVYAPTVKGDYNETVFSLTGGLTGLFKLSPSFAATLGYRTTANITHSKTLDGYKAIKNADINSTVTNFTLGITFYPSKKGKEQEPADWYVEPDPVYTTNTYITNNVTREYIRNYNQSSCECDMLEYVFFEHDQDILLQSELNAIAQVYTYLKNNLNSKLNIFGYASATSSSHEYNLELSKRRATKVYNKLEQMGADMSRVNMVSYGKDLNWSNEMVHDMARRVELIIVKK